MKTKRKYILQSLRNKKCAAVCGEITNVIELISVKTKC